jgi:hypothetical protein
MGRDEAGTLARLRAHRRELIDPKVAEHRGRIVKTTGDGILIEFPSVVEAVTCAVAIQMGQKRKPLSPRPSGRFGFRKQTFARGDVNVAKAPRPCENDFVGRRDARLIHAAHRARNNDSSRPIMRFLCCAPPTTLSVFTSVDASVSAREIFQFCIARSRVLTSVRRPLMRPKFATGPYGSSQTGSKITATRSKRSVKSWLAGPVSHRLCAILSFRPPYASDASCRRCVTPPRLEPGKPLLSPAPPTRYGPSYSRAPQ